MLSVLIVIKQGSRFGVRRHHHLWMSSQDTWTFPPVTVPCCLFAEYSRKRFWSHDTSHFQCWFSY